MIIYFVFLRHCWRKLFVNVIRIAGVPGVLSSCVTAPRSPVRTCPQGVNFRLIPPFADQCYTVSTPSVSAPCVSASVCVRVHVRELPASVREESVSVSAPSVPVLPCPCCRVCVHVVSVCVHAVSGPCRSPSVSCRPCPFAVRARSPSVPVRRPCRDRDRASFAARQAWSAEQRLSALDQLLDVSDSSQVRHMMQVIKPRFQRDFISLLPRELALHVLAFLPGWGPPPRRADMPQLEATRRGQSPLEREVSRTAG